MLQRSAMVSAQREGERMSHEDTHTEWPCRGGHKVRPYFLLTNLARYGT